MSGDSNWKCDRCGAIRPASHSAACQRQTVDDTRKSLAETESTDHNKPQRIDAFAARQLVSYALGWPKEKTAAVLRSDLSIGLYGTINADTLGRFIKENFADRNNHQY